MSKLSERCILAIDLGTSGAKVGVISTHGRIFEHAFEGVGTKILPDGGAEQDPDEWWTALKKAWGKILRKKSFKPEQVDAICCTGQWSGTVAVDRDGKPLMNAIIWMDSRGARYINDLTGGLIRVSGYGVFKLPRWIRLTGGIPAHSGKDSIAHILFIKNAFPDIYSGTYKFLEPKDYLNLRLTGRFAATYDSIALHWVTDNRDISHIHYDRNLLKHSGVDPDKLPELIGACDVLGTLRKDVAEELGLHQSVKVIGGTPDMHSAAIGSGAVRDYEGHLHIGTSSWLICHVPFKKTDVFHNMASLPSALPGRYFVANEQETAGACLDFLGNALITEMGTDKTRGFIPLRVKREGYYALFNEAAGSIPPGSGGVIFTPWLYGERTPVENSTLRGSFFNLSLDTTWQHLVRAVFEGVAYNSRWLLRHVERFTGKMMEGLRMIGGGARSELWCQIHADVLNRSVYQVEEPAMSNLRGAAFLASIALGHLNVEDIPGCVPVAKVFTPDKANSPVYEGLYDEFIRFYKKVKGIYSRLNG